MDMVNRFLTIGRHVRAPQSYGILHKPRVVNRIPATLGFGRPSIPMYHLYDRGSTEAVTRPRSGLLGFSLFNTKYRAH